MRWLGSSVLKSACVAVNLLHDEGTGDFQITVDGLDRIHVVKYAATFPRIKADLTEAEPADDPIVWFSGTNPAGGFWTSLRWLCNARCSQRLKLLLATSLRATVARYLRY